ncbi:tyrosine-type recombinase/integrase [Streptomyces geranii]|uniref:tyrosine-type recombinase/integrase n=1 Tax=Streptomyces geranii TaxID=2058923 RepID=UPI0018E5590B|nr:site-specific integrase [Streptomyces geranii]
MATTVALLRRQPTAFKPVDVRTALREFAFNTRRREEVPPEVAAILKWVERNTHSMAVWEDPVKVEALLRAVDTRLDGKRAAAWSVKRTRRILNVAMEYAVKHQILLANPLPKARGTTPSTSKALDRRALINPHQMARILDRIRRRPRGGRRLHAYFATVYYTGPRPEEAAAMYVEDFLLPAEDAEDQWCEVVIHTATPEVGRNWTNDGEIHEVRGLKGRATDDTRVVPGPPALTKVIREHVRKENLKPGDRMFQGENGGIIAGSVVRRAWLTARKAELAEREGESSMGRRIYDIRHTRLTKWLNDGIPPVQAAYWAGNSVAVLLTFYANCIEGQLPELKRRMEAQGDLPELPEGD